VLCTRTTCRHYQHHSFMASWSERIFQRIGSERTACVAASACVCMTDREVHVGPTLDLLLQLEDIRMYGQLSVLGEAVTGVQSDGMDWCNNDSIKYARGKSTWYAANC
jgi:hypothetical protein